VIGLLAALAVAAADPTIPGNWRPPELRVADRDPVETFRELEPIALRYLGRPYVFGGNGRPGLDCSGYTCRVFAEAGYAIPRVSRDQARSGRFVQLDALQPGDLLFFAEPGAPISHVGIYMGGGQLAHASSGRGEVVVAPLNGGWFQRRLVAARRVLNEEASLLADSGVTELEEHTGMFQLPLPLRVPEGAAARGPQWFGPDRTHVGVRTGLVTEAGAVAPVVAPEVGLSVRPWGLVIGLGAPIRIDPDQGPRVGPVDDVGDVTRFLRTLRVGLPGADFELGLERQRAYSLGTGHLVRDFAPAAGFRGVAGLSVERSPLTLFGRVRVGSIEVAGLVDDVVQPDVLGAHGAWSLTDRWRLGGTYVLEEDQTAHLAGLSVGWQLVDRRAWKVDTEAGAQLRHDDGRGAAAGGLRAGFTHRFGERLDQALGASAWFSVAGSRFVVEPVGPVRPVARAELAAAAAAAGLRPWGGAGAHLSVGSLDLDLRYGQGLQADGSREDRLFEVGWALQRLPLSPSRWLSLRGRWSARRPFRDPLFAAWGGAELRLASWLSLEAYALHGPGWEGGGSIRLHGSP
jgi:hypothetical protein